jgi:hypothetical protein
MPVGQRDQNRERLLTGATVVIVGLALALLVMVVTSGGGGSRGAKSRRAPPDPTTSSRAVYVAPTGCDDNRTVDQARRSTTPWCSLDHAAQAAPRESEIRVGPGKYPTLRLVSSSSRARDLTFRAADPRRRPELAGVELKRVSGVAFIGFLFTRGAALDSVRDVRLEHNGFASSWIYIRTSQRVSIVGNRIRRVRGAPRALLAQGAVKPGIPTTEHLVIRGNLFEDIQHDAIAVYNRHRYVTVEGNKISRVLRPKGFELHSDSMQFMGGERLTVRNNVLHDSHQGILIKDGRPSTGLVVAGNLVTRITGAGLQIFNAPGARVSNNTIWGTRFGTIFANDPKVRGRTSVRLDSNVMDQLIVDAGRGARVVGGTGNVFGRGRTYGARARRDRPRFVNPGRGDLRIRSARPGAGVARRGEVPGAQLRVR